MDQEAALPATQASPDVPSTPEVSAPTPDDLSSIEDVATDPAARPEAGSVGDGLSAPQSGDGVADVAVDSESPVLPSPQTLAPAQPTGEEDLSISTEPAQPAPPVVEEDGAFDTPAPADAAAPVPDTDPAQDEESVGPGTNPEAATPPGVSEPATDDTADARVEIGETPSSSTIGNLAQGVTTNRLPSVGTDSQDEPTPATAEDAATTAQPDAESRPPLERFAVPFENPDDKPLMSIILLDEGTGPAGIEALADFPFPISFAIDATLPDAADKAAIYRAAGFEVLAMVNLPEGAGATDAEVAMQATFAAIPEAVAVMEGTGAGLQSSRSAAEQLAPILLESGHGAVFFPKGLNTAQQLLAREGVPAVPVFRDFDANGQNATVIRRFLDQAAFKAGQEDAGVVMLGRLRADTVSALLLWGLQDRANRVALAPISAMLRGE